MSVIHQVRRVIAIMKAEGRSPAAIIASPEMYQLIEDEADDLRRVEGPYREGICTLRLFDVPVYPQTGFAGIRVYAAACAPEEALRRMFVRVAVYDMGGKREDLAIPNPNLDFSDLLI